MAEDGRVYERSAIEEWLKTNEKSPHTNEPMGTKLLPALRVKNMIAKMVESGALSGDKCAAWTQKLEQEKEFESWRQRAEAGDTVAMTEVGCLYQTGTGVKEDMAAGFQWLKRAADLNNVVALTLVAACRLDGDGTTKNVLTGFIEMGQAAGLGSEHACFYLANAYHHGLYGLKKDRAQVAHWAAEMQRAAGNGKCDCNEESRARMARYLAASQ